MARTKTRIEAVEILSEREKIRRLRVAFFEALQPSEYLDLDQWSDRYRVLPTETSSEAGQWNTARFPFMRTIMKCLSPASPARSIVFQKAAQVAGTEAGICWALYCADLAMGGFIYTQASDGAVESYSKQKLAPSIAACERVRYLLGDKKPGHLSDTITDKGFPGGWLALGPANSEKFTRSKSAPYVHVDEEDSYESNSDGGGSPINNLQKRQVNFPHRKMFRTSTPKIKETSTIAAAYEFGSQEQYYVPCPHCNPIGHRDGAMFVIKWEDIKWTKTVDKKTGLPAEVWLDCPLCGGRIEETSKTWMLEKGDWFSLKDSDYRYTVDPKTENRSFQISSFYSPFGFFSWRDAVQEWFEYLAKRDVNRLQVFINQTCGETFTLEGQEISYHNLATRVEEYGPAYPHEVPRGGLVLTAGVDIQADRIECEVVAWGLYDENWSVDYVVLPGDTSQLGDHSGMTADGQPSVWLLLDQYLQRRFRHASGADMPIEITMIDSGHRGEEVHTFCRLREGRRVFPVKGKEGWGFGMWQVNRKRHERHGTFLYLAMVDELKNKVYSMLSIDTPGPGFCHFPKRDNYGDKYFKGLVCESRRTKNVGGKTRLYWFTPPGARNEPLDCRNYAYVARLAYPVDLSVRAQSVGLIPQPSQVVAPAAPAPRRRRGSSGL